MNVDDGTIRRLREINDLCEAERERYVPIRREMTEADHGISKGFMWFVLRARASNAGRCCIRIPYGHPWNGERGISLDWGEYYVDLDGEPDEDGEHWWMVASGMHRPRNESVELDSEKALCLWLCQQAQDAQDFQNVKD